MISTPFVSRWSRRHPPRSALTSTCAAGASRNASCQPCSARSVWTRARSAATQRSPRSSPHRPFVSWANVRTVPSSRSRRGVFRSPQRTIRSALARVRVERLVRAHLRQPRRRRDRRVDVERPRSRPTSTLTARSGHGSSAQRRAARSARATRSAPRAGAASAAGRRRAACTDVLQPRLGERRAPQRQRVDGDLLQRDDVGRDRQHRRGLLGLAPQPARPRSTRRASSGKLPRVPGRPNVLYLHSHDTGRYVQPYGHRVPTPNIQRLADQGVLFRQAFVGGAELLGQPRRAADRRVQPPQRRHRARAPRQRAGRRRRPPRRHPARRRLPRRARRRAARRARGERARVGHGSPRCRPTMSATSSPRRSSCSPAVSPAPLMLSVGFTETHREFPEPTRATRSTPCRPAHLPDTPETRRDTAGLKASVRSLDQGVGSVLEAFDEADLADETLVILTTDHGIGFPGAKATLTDRGTGVMLILRGPGGFHGGACRRRARHAPRPLPDRVRARRRRAGRPAWLEGRSLVPLVAGEVAEVHDAVFAEMTFHAAYEPLRAVRTSAGSTSAASTTSPGRCLAERRRLAEQGPAAAARMGRTDGPARAPPRPGLRPRRGGQPRRRSRLRRVCSLTCARGWSGGCGRPATRSSTAPSRPRRASSTTTQDQLSAEEPTRRA